MWPLGCVYCYEVVFTSRRRVSASLLAVRRKLEVCVALKAGEEFLVSDKKIFITMHACVHLYAQKSSCIG